MTHVFTKFVSIWHVLRRRFFFFGGKMTEKKTMSQNHQNHDVEPKKKCWIQHKIVSGTSASMLNLTCYQSTKHWGQIFFSSSIQPQYCTVLLQMQYICNNKRQQQQLNGHQQRRQNVCSCIWAISISYEARVRGRCLCASFDCNKTVNEWMVCKKGKYEGKCYSPLTLCEFVPLWRRLARQRSMEKTYEAYDLPPWYLCMCMCTLNSG